MAHFGSVDWPTPYGRVAALEKTSLTLTTGAGATEGSNLLTYTAARTGMYRVSAYIRLRTTGTGASQAVVAHVTYNNGTAITTASIGASGLTPGVRGVVEGTDAVGANLNQTQLIQAVAGTAIVMNTVGSGTFTTAAVIDVYFVIEAV